MSISSPVMTPEKPKFLAQVRHSAIMDRLNQVGSVTVSELAQILCVSDMTIRRDLVELEKAGMLSRTHGGAVACDRMQTSSLGSHMIEGTAQEKFDRDEPAFERRRSENAELKRRIALIAVDIAASARSIALDVGTTTYLMSEMMGTDSQSKIFTNNIRAATLLAERGMEVYLAGGKIREEEMSTSGAAALHQFGALWFDVAFVGVSGLNLQGMFDYSFEEVDMKRLYLARATRKIILCDSTKFGQMSLVHVADLTKIDTLITDSPPPQELMKALENSDVEVLVAA